ncbi:histamine H3 receptor-like [Paramacrobiotus metropolitanus]|uniref:histamine H3 receptor-like n=1 Tax=Paramacrobiotus metropolitanus TaxID=2943436 RepID=UPI00244649F7|nr:histamine H3 receptor-like [Paramacrobiotus metropolitanus]
MDTNGTDYPNVSDAAYCSHPVFYFAKPEIIVIAIIGIPQSILTAVCNVFVILTFIRRKELQTPQHFYFINLAFCDLLLGSFSMPTRLTLDLLGCWPAPFAFCRVCKIIDWICSAETATTVMLIARHRYKMVTHGAQFAAEESGRYVIQKIVLTWVVNIGFYGTIQFVDLFTGQRLSPMGQCMTEFFQIQWLGDLAILTENILPSVVVVIIYVLVYMTLRQRRKRIVMALEESHQVKDEKEKSGTNRQSHRRTTKQGTTMMLLCAVFLAVNFPCALISLVMLVYGNTFSLLRWYTVSLYLFYGNSLINPIVYTLKIPTMRMIVVGCFRTNIWGSMRSWLRL